MSVDLSWTNQSLTISGLTAAVHLKFLKLALGPSVIEAGCSCVCQKELPLAPVQLSRAARPQDSLAAPLRHELLALSGRSNSAPASGERDRADGLRLATLLRLYTAALAAHATCAGLNPQVAPLPGQGAAAAEHTPESGARQAGGQGYFDALGALGQGPEPAAQPASRGAWGAAPARLPSLLEVLAHALRGCAAAAGAGSAGRGRAPAPAAERFRVSAEAAPGPHFLPAAACALQRMALLEERVLRLCCTCPLGAPEAADGAARCSRTWKGSCSPCTSLPALLGALAASSALVGTVGLMCTPCELICTPGQH